MLKFREIEMLQKFASVHALIDMSITIKSSSRTTQMRWLNGIVSPYEPSRLLHYLDRFVLARHRH